MQENFKDLLAFITVAREKSFTRAAAQLGVSQSALSHTIRGLEERLGIRLLTRTTRSVSTTEAGSRLLNAVAPRFQEISEELQQLSEFRETPAGTFKITTAEHAATCILWPKLTEFLPKYPDIKVEINIDYGLTDIVAAQFDAGVRLGDQVAKDMVAMRIAPDMKIAVVASKDYFERYPVPMHPCDLANHRCINLRFPTHNSLMTWEFMKNGEEVKVRVDGQLTFNNGSSMYKACLDGFGLTYLPDDMVADEVASGNLVSVLKDWCPVFPGYHLYYPSRKLKSPGFALLVEAFRYQQPG